MPPLVCEARFIGASRYLSGIGALESDMFYLLAKGRISGDNTVRSPPAFSSPCFVFPSLKQTTIEACCDLVRQHISPVLQ